MLAPQPFAGYRILVLEDEFLIAMDVEQLCHDNGAREVVLLRDLGEVGDAAGDQEFDVAIVDVMLAGNSTLPFAKTLFERNIPFVFATGYAGGGDRFTEFPGVPVVGKPYDGAELVDAVTKAIGLARLR